MTTLYLDMDGVIADFDEYAFRTLGLPPSEGVYAQAEWVRLAANPRIYRDLVKTPYADDLIAFCKEYCTKHEYDLKFLSAVPKGNDVPWSFYDKVNWARNYYPTIPVFFGPFSKDKWQRCEPGDILIDDRLSNITAWMGQGGRAILHKDYATTISKLKSFV
jgi:5'(3')-deoxyribonucleotidase